MRPKEKVKTHAQGLLEDRRLDLMLRMEHELVRLAAAIAWDGLSESFGALYSEKTGRPGIPIRTMAGLVMLQHTFGLSDEQVVREWPERPYWQFFCGEEFFQHELPVDFSQISRWRKRIGKEGVERILKLTIEAGLRTQTITPKQMQVVVVDTTVQPKAVEHPTDARLSTRPRPSPATCWKWPSSKCPSSPWSSAKAAVAAPWPWAWPTGCS
jgi:IS5 family transposase